MTVTTSTNSIVYRGNGAATQFAVPFKVLDEDHLVVKRRVFATGVEEYTYVGTDYSYSGIGASSGTLTLAGAALSSTYELVIQRIVPYTQDLDIVNAGGFYPETVEEQLDLMMMGIQQIADLVERGVLVPVGENVLELPRASERAGKFFAFDAAGAAAVASGLGADSALRTDLAAANGSALVRYDPLGAGAVAGTVQAKARLRHDLVDRGTAGAGTAAIQAFVDLFTSGFQLHLPHGTTTLTGRVYFDEQRPSLIGQGIDVSGIYGNFAGAVPLFTVGDGTVGGVYQSEFSNFSVAIAGVEAKTVFRVENCGHVKLEDLGAPAGSILGDSIFLDLVGREFVHLGGIKQAIACARPVVIRPNPSWPTLCCDHSTLDGYLIGTSATRPIIELTELTVSSNLTIGGALVGGRQAVYGRNTGASATSNNMLIWNGRAEQPLDPAAFCIDIDNTGASAALRSLCGFNFLTSSDQHGMKLRGVNHTTLIGFGFPQAAAQTALDVTLPTGGSLNLLGCEGQVGSTKTLSNSHPVFVIPSPITGVPIGSVEHHVAWTTPPDPGAGNTYNYEGLPIEQHGGVSVASFRFTFPIGTRVLKLPLCVPAGMTVDADVVARAPNGRLTATFHKDGTVTAHSATGIFATVATGGDIYPTAGGFLTGDTLVAAVTISVEIRQ